ncbi:MAG: J domain-containing protein [Clostridia bacterium]|nr:J domain-containing protein [Clostridia bacterium]
MKYKNYYKILGLSNDKATDEDIKNSYRKLAKLYHPDINPGDVIAAEKFKDINEAYQILGSEESKKKYDRVHFAYKLKDGLNFSNIKDAFNGENGFNEFFEMFVGKNEKNVVTNLDKKQNKNIPIPGEDIESEIEATLEEVFNGEEKKIAFRTTDGKMKTITVKIPQGIRNGGKIRIADQGKPGKNGGAQGDLYIKVNILKHEKYKLDGANLLMDLPLTPWEAALGCNIEIESIDSKVLIAVPAGIQSGEKLRIASHGYYDGYGLRGDLLAEVKIVVPKTLTKEETQLYTNLKNISCFSPRGN